ncbi:MAG TPA: hypothetical protein VFA65_12725 [Bryobacteraceae bacterium]|nr:hypothetical protein [Bryobacteraceae bacterium]
MNIFPKQCLITAATAVVLLLSSCSPAPKTADSDSADKPAAPAGPPQPVTAKTAFWPMYMAARSWATDLVTLKVDSKDVGGVKNQDGKAALWEATFASPTQHAYRVYTYAIAAYPPDIYKGVTSGQTMDWGGPTSNVLPVQLSDFSTDSDAAYTAAAAEASAWLKKNPDKPLTGFALGNAAKFGAPVWVLTWGSDKSGYRAYVNATTGKVLSKK